MFQCVRYLFAKIDESNHVPVRLLDAIDDLLLGVLKRIFLDDKEDGEASGAVAVTDSGVPQIGPSQESGCSSFL